MRRRYDPPIDSPELCVHHWICGDQFEQVVHAVCRKCGVEIDFTPEPCLWGWYPQPSNDRSMPWTQVRDGAGVIRGREASY
jgi:hypothetical protein